MYVSPPHLAVPYRVALTGAGLATGDDEPGSEEAADELAAEIIDDYFSGASHLQCCFQLVRYPCTRTYI